jgi:hypothetical protein
MPRLSPCLSYSGSLPFVFCALCFTLDARVIPFIGNTDQVLSVYALVIASFIAGSHWGQHLYLNGKWGLYLPTSSNINAIFLWISFLILPFKLLLIVFIISFLASLFIDKKLFQEKCISLEYFYTRTFVTIIVISALIISGVYV